MEVHWLPVDKRIEYKLRLYTYKALHGAGVPLWIGCAVSATESSMVSRIELTNGYTRETW